MTLPPAPSPPSPPPPPAPPTPPTRPPRAVPYKPNFPGYLARVSLAWFCLSLLFDGVDAGAHTESVRGLTLLLNGWMGYGDGIFPWLANPLLALSWWLMLGRRQFTAAALAAALALAVMSHWSAGTLAPAVLAQGYLLWVASAVLQLLAAGLASLIALFKSMRTLARPLK